MVREVKILPSELPNWGKVLQNSTQFFKFDNHKTRQIFFMDFKAFSI